MNNSTNTFQCFTPASLNEALQHLAELGNSAMLIAGGTDLVMDVKRRGKAPGHLISLTSIPELANIHANGGLRIGAASIFHHINQSPVIKEKCTMLAEAAGCVGSRQVRNLATIGGNVCNALPCADSVASLVAAGAQARLASPHGERLVAVENFITGPRKTILQAREILVEFILPDAPACTGSAYFSFTPRRALDLTIVGAAAQVSIDPHNGQITAASIALGNVNPAPVNARQAASLLLGCQPSEELLSEVAEAALQGTHTRDSAVRASAEYRRQLVRVLTRRAVSQAYARAQACAKSSQEK